jgi:large conductance mechanosensitive channel
MLKDFREFIAKGNVMDMAVGVIIGAAFGRVVTSLVEQVLMPPLGLVLGKVDFSNLSAILSLDKFDNLDAAKKAGVPIIYYGQFINTVVNFLIVALALFFVIKAVNRLKRKAAPPAPSTKDCPLCCMAIPVNAARCGHCTSEIAPA